MEAVIILILLFVIISLCGLVFYVIEAFGKEKKVYLDHIQDLTDKVYFLRTRDFVTNKVVNETTKQGAAPEKKEEEGIPLENVDPNELYQALGGEPQPKK